MPEVPHPLHEPRRFEVVHRDTPPEWVVTRGPRTLRVGATDTLRHTALATGLAHRNVRRTTVGAAWLTRVTARCCTMVIR